MDLMTDSERFLELARNRNFSNPETNAILALVYRSYWTRVWIIPEVYFARYLTVKCGARNVPGDVFQYCVGVVTFQLNTQFQDTAAIKLKSSVLRLFNCQIHS